MFQGYRLCATASLVVFVLCSAATGQQPKSSASEMDKKTVTLKRPPSRPLDSNKPMSCGAIATATLHENLGDDRFSAPGITGEIGPGTDKLAIQIKGDKLLVTTKSAFERGTAEPDIYQITRHTKSWLAAVRNGPLIPAVYSIVVNKENGFAVWSLNEPVFFPGSQYPYTETIYLKCH